MPSSLKIKIQIVEKIAGPIVAQKLIKKIKDEGNYKIIKRSDNSLRLLVLPIVDYVDNFCDGDYSILDMYTILEIHKLYENSVHKFKMKLSPKNYKEINKIILDYRINNIGFYWIDYMKSYSIEMAIRMDNCGRVKHGDTILELRENINEDNTISNYSRVYVVYNKQSGNIIQIKGQSNERPEKHYFDYIFKLFMESGINFVEYKPGFKPQNDFRVSFFPKHQKEILKEKMPKLFTSIKKLI